MAESELLELLKIYTFLTNVKQPMQMQINVEISVEFFCTTLLARRLVPLSAQGRNTNVRRQVFWLSGSLPRIWSRICTQSPKIQQEIDSGKLINFSLNTKYYFMDFFPLRGRVGIPPPHFAKLFTAE